MREAAKEAISQTRSRIALPSKEANGFPGNLLELYLAGMTIIVFIIEFDSYEVEKVVYLTFYEQRILKRAKSEVIALGTILEQVCLRLDANRFLRVKETNSYRENRFLGRIAKSVRRRLRKRRDAQIRTSSTVPAVRW